MLAGTEGLLLVIYQTLPRRKGKKGLEMDGLSPLPRKLVSPSNGTRLSLTLSYHYLKDHTRYLRTSTFIKCFPLSIRRGSCYFEGP